MILIAIQAVYLLFILYVRLFATLLSKLEWQSLLIHGFKILRFSIRIDYKCFTYPFILLCKNYKSRIRNVRIFYGYMVKLKISIGTLLGLYNYQCYFSDGTANASY